MASGAPNRLMVAPGEQWGRWTILGEAGKDGRGERRVWCRCECGTVKEVRYHSLRRGDTYSCGCLRREADQHRKASRLADRKAARSVSRCAGRHADGKPCTAWKMRGSDFCRHHDTPSAVNAQPGEQWGRWTVLGEAAWGSGGRRVLCRCECGTEKTVNYDNLRRGLTKSCGCLAVDLGRLRVTHGETRKGEWAPEYRAWSGMKTRCYCPKNKKYADYGGRGITVCSRWLDSYERFLADVGRRPSPSHSLDRIDVNGNYEPGNVRWATPTEQVRNRRNTLYLTVNDETCPLGEWAERTGIAVETLRYRLKAGWLPEDTVPVPKSAETTLLMERTSG